jgi:hypothetical protein
MTGQVETDASALGDGSSGRRLLAKRSEVGSSLRRRWQKAASTPPGSRTVSLKQRRDFGSGSGLGEGASLDADDETYPPDMEAQLDGSMDYLSSEMESQMYSNFVPLPGNQELKCDAGSLQGLQLAVLDFATALQQYVTVPGNGKTEALVDLTLQVQDYSDNFKWIHGLVDDNTRGAVGTPAAPDLESKVQNVVAQASKPAPSRKMSTKPPAPKRSMSTRAPTPLPTWAPTPAIPACSGIAYLVASTTPTAISDGSAQYPSDKYCVWVVSGSGPITIKFSSFATESNFDVVKIYNGGSVNAGLLNTFSGSSLPSPVTSTGNSVTIVFSSDSSIEAAGFAATVTSSVKPAARDCGAGTITASSTPITLSDGPANYARLANCLWTVAATGASPSITVTFTSFATETNYDFVKIYNGTEATSGTLLRSLSGSPAVPFSVAVKATSIVITLTSDDMVETAGFEASVVAS